MTWIIFLAGFMAVFGVIGYLRGVRAAVAVLIAGLAGLLIIGPYGATVIRYINAFGKGFRFLASGGMAALTGSGSADAALAALQSTPPLVQETDNAVVLGLLYIVIVLIGLLLTAIPWFKGKRSVGGLLLGLIAGYLVGAVIVRAFWPQYIPYLPLPILGEPAAPVVLAPVAGPAATGFGSQLVSGLNALASSSLLPIIIAIAIVLFILAATRSGNRSAKG
jgi:hypothetical protein